MDKHMSGVDTQLVTGVSKLERVIPISPNEYKSQIQPIYAALGKYDIDHFDTDINPLSVITLDPSEIVYNTGREWKPWQNRRRLVGRVMDGDWHACNPKLVPEHSKPYPKKFNNMVVYRSFRDHFIHGKRWEDTPIYDRWMATALSGDNTTYAGTNDVKNRLEYMNELFYEIKTNGYKSQLEMSNRTSGYLESVLNEINIDIGPSGQPLFVDGRHRLSIAKLLEIDEIPAFVLVRHRRWVNK